MVEPWYKKYRKMSKEIKGKDFKLWKTLLNGALMMARSMPYEPYVEMMLDNFVNVGRARIKGKPLIGHPFNYGPELLHAMDLQPFMQELLTVGLAPFHANEPYLDFTNELGYGDNPTICNAQRPVIGLHIKGLAPVPDFMLYLSTPCNSLSSTYQVFQHLTGVESFHLDIPYWSYSKDKFSDLYDEKTLDYVINQQKNLISWLEEKTKHKFDEEKFKQAMVWVNQARQNIMEFNELLRAVPCPVNSSEAQKNFSAMIIGSGTPEAVKVTKYLRDNAAANVKKGVAGVPDERIRIAWPFTHVFFDPALIPYLEETFHAVAIMDILSFYQVKPHDTSTLEKCFKSLAKGILDFSMISACRGPADFFVDYVLHWVKDYKCDCVVIPVQFACHHTYAVCRLASEAVREELGIPTLIVPCDPYDSRDVPAETIRGRISEFLTEVVM
ncbi:MAG: 2-hydroxyacyl-CoA dehydratase [Candidatus Helarchaeota archaeon]|nr:2-hydroxyacyl-CoA dehydratase [Candidatus Helarchaeota archaeon]